MYLELALVVLLVVLMYQKSHFLNNFVVHPLAKLVLLVAVVAMTHYYGRNAGIISGLIALLLLHNMFEGMESKGDDESTNKSSKLLIAKNPESKDSTDSDDESTDSDDESTDSDDESTDSDNKSTKGTPKVSVKSDKSPIGEKVITVSETLLEPVYGNDKTSMEDEMRKPKDSNKDTQGVAANPQLADNQQDPFAMPSKTKESFTLLN